MTEVGHPHLILCTACLPPEFSVAKDSCVDHPTPNADAQCNGCGKTFRAGDWALYDAQKVALALVSKHTAVTPEES